MTTATEDKPTFAARHSMDSDSWYTPSAFVEAAREVMGVIDLDPASHEEANRTVKAAKFFTVEDNGLDQDWHGNVFLNPPGGLVNEFWRKLLREFLPDDGTVFQAIWVGYSLEQLQTLQRNPITPLNYPTCFTRQRIAFVENTAKRSERIAKMIAAGKKPNEKSSPSHSNYITYLGSEAGRARFVDVFSRFGQVK